jgi:hypothetical protein
MKVDRGCCRTVSVSMQGYFGKRLGRASTIHGLAGMAAIMASTYKAYLGEGLGPLSFIKRLKIPHPGRVSLLWLEPPTATLGHACPFAEATSDRRRPKVSWQRRTTL